jgi:hypothetical protein
MTRWCRLPTPLCAGRRKEGAKSFTNSARIMTPSSGVMPRAKIEVLLATGSPGLNTAPTIWVSKPGSGRCEPRRQAASTAAVTARRR